MIEWLIGLGPMISVIIHCAAGFCLACFILSIYTAHHINKQMNTENEADYKKWTFFNLNLIYNIFIAVVSIFPLLGMLGTVLALLGLDLSSDTSGMQQQFFLALDTTAWGLIYSIFFKFLHSFAQTTIETAIVKIDEMIKKTFQ